MAEDQQNVGFGDIFDLSFKKYVTPTVIRVLFILVIVFAALWWLFLVIAGFSSSAGAGFGALDPGWRRVLHLHPDVPGVLRARHGDLLDQGEHQGNRRRPPEPGLISTQPPSASPLGGGALSRPQGTWAQPV